MQAFGVVQIPTFVFLRGGQTVETIRTADAALLRQKLTELTQGSSDPCASVGSSTGANSLVPSVAPVPGFVSAFLNRQFSLADGSYVHVEQNPLRMSQLRQRPWTRMCS